MRQVTITKTIPNLSKTAAKRWARFTEESNKEFQKMTPAQKRVQIAKDVVAQLKVKAFNAQRGTYVDSTEGLDTRTSKQLFGLDLSIAIPYIPTCDVCAVGSVMICTIMRDNHVVYDQPDGTLDFSGDPAYEVAKRFFTQAQLNEMENVFEGWSPPPEDSHYGDGYVLTLIMEYVIHAGGSFRRAGFESWHEEKTKKTKKPGKARAFLPEAG